MTVYYEWDVEEQDANGDVVEHNHVSSYADACTVYNARLVQPDDGFTYHIVLVRDDDDRRAWAYMEDDKLPTHFVDGSEMDYRKVPKRFHDEVSNT